MLNNTIRFFELTGLNWLIPIANLIAGKNPKQQVNALLYAVGVPVVAFLIFLFFWSLAAQNVVTSLGNLPGPTQTWEQTVPQRIILKLITIVYPPPSRLKGATIEPSWSIWN
jgi:nitrate/nitrite transport system permease protein